MPLIHPEALVDRIRGALVGTVVDNQDPEGIYRVKVKYVVPSGDIESAWARMVTRMGGPEMGWACLPEPEDEVLLRFVNGHPDQPMIVGALWNGSDKPPFDNADGENNLRLMVSRNGHEITYDDTDGAEAVTVETTEQKTKMHMMTADKLIHFEATKDIILKVGNLLTVEAGADIEMGASAGYKHQAGSNCDMESGGTTDISGSAGVAITSAAVAFKA